MSELDRILERLSEVPPVSDESAARRLSEVGVSRYQRHSAHLHPEDVTEEAAGDDTTITVDLRSKPDPAPERDVVAASQPEDVLPS